MTAREIESYQNKIMGMLVAVPLIALSILLLVTNGCGDTPQTQFPPTFRFIEAGGDGWVRFSVNDSEQYVKVAPVVQSDGKTCVAVTVDVDTSIGIVSATGAVPGLDKSCGEASPVITFRPGSAGESDTVGADVGPGSAID